MRTFVTVLLTIITMATGLVAPYKATAAEVMEDPWNTGCSMAELVESMKEHQHEPYMSGLRCCHGAWVAYSQGRVVTVTVPGSGHSQVGSMMSGLGAILGRGSE